MIKVIKIIKMKKMNKNEKINGKKIIKNILNKEKKAKLKIAERCSSSERLLYVF